MFKKDEVYALLRNWTTTSEIVNPNFYRSVPPMSINVLLLTGACLIYNSLAFIVGIGFIILSLFCTLSCTFLLHVCCMISINYG